MPSQHGEQSSTNTANNNTSRRRTRSEIRQGLIAQGTAFLEEQERIANGTNNNNAIVLSNNNNTSAANAPLITSPTDDFVPYIDPVTKQRARRRPRVTNTQKALGAFGQFIAVAYGLLCGIGITSSVFNSFGNLGIAFAVGATSFFVNVGFFFFVVPAMFRKLPKADIFDESDVTKDGRYVKITNKLGKTKLVSPIRGFLIFAFMAFFGAAAALTYTGRLIMELPETLGLLGINAGGSALMGISIFFFAVSTMANWFFNTYDASEEFSKADFFRKLKMGIKKFGLVDSDPALLLDGEKYDENLWFGDDQNVGWLAMKGRQLFRLGILGGVFYLGYFAISSIAGMGASALFEFFKVAAPAELQAVFIAFSIIGASFLFSVQATRFTTIMTNLFTTLAHFYANAPATVMKNLFGYEPADKNTKTFLSGLLHITLVVPVLAVVLTGLYKAVMAQLNFASKAYNRYDKAGLKKAYLNELQDHNDDLWEDDQKGKPSTDKVYTSVDGYVNRPGFSAWLNRAGMDGKHCYQAFSPYISVLAAIPAAVVTVFHFLRENIYTLAVVNLMANGLLAVKSNAKTVTLPDGTELTDRSLDLKNLTDVQIKEGIGGALASGMCATNKYAQDVAVDKGESSNMQETYLNTTVLYWRNRAMNDDKQYYTNDTDVEIDASKVGDRVVIDRTFTAW